MKGKIIKYFRKKANMTQERLCKGICSVSHLSKIERGSTEYSQETVTLLSQRLGIKLNEEIDKYNKTAGLLNQWYDAILMQKENKIYCLKQKIEKDDFISLDEHYYLYLLLLCRFHLYTNNLKNTYNILIKIEKQHKGKLNTRESHLFEFLLGMYQVGTSQFRAAIKTLKGVDPQYIHRGDYYYQLTIAHHATHSHIKAFYYGTKALDVFQEDLNMPRIIDTKTLMLLQLNAGEPYSPEYTEKEYLRLIEICKESCQNSKKSTLLNNLGFEYIRIGLYECAFKLSGESLAEINEENPNYLTHLEQYLYTSLRGRLLQDEELINIATRGLELAVKKNDNGNAILFQLHIYTLKQNDPKYYDYLETTAIPYFRDSGYQLFVDYYGKKLFYYYCNQGNKDKALSLAKSIIDAIKTFDEKDITLGRQSKV